MNLFCSSQGKICFRKSLFSYIFYEYFVTVCMYDSFISFLGGGGVYFLEILIILLFDFKSVCVYYVLNASSELFLFEL